MRRKSGLWKVTLCILFIAANLAPAAAIEPLWVRALPGEVIAGPVVRDDRVYITGSDRSITCLSEDGTFLWNRRLPGKRSPWLTTGSFGSVYTVSEPGYVTAYNADGSLLWQLSGSSLPVCPPHEGRDGRLFLVYRDSVSCVTSTGLLLWKLKIPSVPSGYVSDTYDGDLLVVISESAILRISPFGELLETISHPESVSSLYPIPGGFVSGSTHGVIRGFDVRDNRPQGRPASEVVWQYNAGSVPLGFCSGEGTLLAVQADGSLAGLNATDGTRLWIGNSAISSSGFSVSWEYGQFNIVSGATACAVTSRGKTAWSLSLPGSLTNPAISTAGYIFAAGRDYSLSAYLAENRIRAEKKVVKSANYGILNGKSAEYGLSYAADYHEIQHFFDEVAQSLASGSVGPKEVSYARRLAEIIRNDSGELMASRQFDSVERARAASLLGQLGSPEYRDTLLSFVREPFDETFVTGLLYGLASCGMDPDGETLSAVQYLVRAAGVNNSEIQKRACDCLYALIRYSSGKRARESTTYLAGFTRSPWDTAVQEYARQMLGNILQ